MNMAKRQILVTGSSGIAAALIRALDKREDSIFILGGTDQDSEKLIDECRNIKGFSSIDLRDEAECVKGFDQASETLNGITDVVGIVGGSGRKFGDARFGEIPFSGWNETLNLNLGTAFLTLREGIRALSKDGGSITLTSSVLATSPVYEGFSTHAYATSKYSIEGMTKLAAASYVEEKIRINAVAPALVTTPMSKRATADPQIQHYVQIKQPLSNGQLSAESLVSAYIYCIDNPYITGEILTVDGGWRSVKRN
jgi:NAD(P)-dependent dehydrogenase (short-subunit alcohol dehydrogenase family)